MSERAVVSFRLLVCTFIHTYIFIMLTPSSHTITFACPPFSFGHRAREKERAPTSWHIFNFRLFFFIFLSLVYLLLFVFLFQNLYKRKSYIEFNTNCVECVCFFIFYSILFIFLFNERMYVRLYVHS